MLFVWLFYFQLAGVVAVEVTGGPTIDFVPGRRVSYDLLLCKYLMIFTLHIG